MNHSTVSGCGEIEHSENSRKSGQQKNPTARKQLEISIKRTLKIGHCLCRFCAIQQRKKAAAISLPQLFGGSWWIRTTEALSSRFTVCPHWPLGNTPIFSFAVHGLPVYITTRMIVCQHLLRNFWIFVPKAKVQKQKPPRNQRS